MRFGTFNIMHGRSLIDGRVDPAALAAAVTALDVDVLALQEVDQAQPRSAHADLAAVAAGAMGVDASGYRFAAAIVGSPGASYRTAAHDDDGAGDPRYGVALFSRWPVESWHTLRLRASPVPGPVLLPVGPGKARLILLRDEPRIVVAAVLRSPVGPLAVAATHLSFVPGWNAWQLRRVVHWLRALPGPRLLLGDLNLPAGPVRLVSGWRPAARAATYPAAGPRVQLDHVLVDPDGARGDDGAWLLGRPGLVATRAVPLSDHRPLVVEFPPVR